MFLEGTVVFLVCWTQLGAALVHRTQLAVLGLKVYLAGGGTKVIVRNNLRNSVKLLRFS